jgi:hypothetical protein
MSAKGPFKKNSQTLTKTKTKSPNLKKPLFSNKKLKKCPLTFEPINFSLVSIPHFYSKPNKVNIKAFKTMQ